MTHYCHHRVPGVTFFFTVRLLDRGSSLLTDHIAAFSEALRQVRTRKPFHLDAWAVLPDHVHAIWTLPPGDHDCSSRWRAVKIAFSKALHKAGVAGDIWERHYREYRVADDAQYAALLDYLHTDAVRHGMCERAPDWPWSSLHRFLAAGAALPALVRAPWNRNVTDPGLPPG
jgi:putative transposase